ncbi:MAG TPA: hypothetical protein DEA73_05980 [Peptococcaceae bacterium]|nr:hypothetical protein [Peptococcaceae bacterium]
MVFPFERSDRRQGDQTEGGPARRGLFYRWCFRRKHENIGDAGEAISSRRQRPALGNASDAYRRWMEGCRYDIMDEGHRTGGPWANGLLFGER